MTLQDYSKERQIFENRLFSEDVLIRSTKENVRNVLPYIEQMHPFVKHYELFELAMLNKFRRQNQAKVFSEADGGAKDESLKEEKLNEYLTNLDRQKKRQIQIND